MITDTLPAARMRPDAGGVTPSGARSGPLTGCRVVEFAGLGPVPFAGMLLSDLGADVVRIDRPSPPDPRQRAYVMNRGRRSIVLDLKGRGGIDAAFRLVERSDILLEGFRPGVMERLGLGPEECLARNERLVYGRMTGWGQDGPLAPVAGHDIDYIAVSGALSTVARHGERPVPPVNLVGDMGGGGAFLALGVVSAMWEAARSARGQVVDAAMVDGSAVLTTMLHGMMAQGRWADEAGANFSDGGSPYYDTYRCSDGRFVAVGAIEDQFYDELIAGLSLDAATLPDRRDRSSWAELKDIFAERFAARTRDEWAELFGSGDACVAPVLGLTEAPGHPHNRARRTFVEIDGVEQPAPAPRFGRTPGAIRLPPPLTGEHTAEVLAELGLGGPAPTRRSSPRAASA